MSGLRRFYSPEWDETPDLSQNFDFSLDYYFSGLFRTSAAFPSIRTRTAHELEETLSVQKTEVADLDRKISSLTSTLGALKEQKSGLDQIIHEHTQLLAPFRRFPDDVLREIFLSCLPADHNAVMDITEAPLLLGRVCSRWRALAYSTPRLWNTLHVCSFAPPLADTTTFWMSDAQHQEILDDFENLFLLHYVAVQDWIARSGALPLSLSINLRSSGIPNYLNRLILGYFDIMFACSDRWRSLEICVPHSICTAILPSLQSLSFPRLEYLHIMFPNGGGYQLDVWNKSNIFHAQKLHALRLSRLPDPPSSLQIDWSRLTQIVLHPMPPTTSGTGKVSLKEAFELLSNCPLIEECGFSVLDARFAESPRGGLPLLMLRSLIIIDEAMQLESLIHRLDVPSLRTITYFTTIPPLSRPSSPLVSLLALTNGRVESLTTSLHFFTVKDLIECFSLLPELTSLTNAKSSWPDVTTKQRRWENGLTVPYARNVMKSILFLLLPNSTNLTPPSSSQCLCPKLHSLILTDSKNLRDTDALSFILQRQRLAANATPGLGVDRLKNVRIAFERAKTVDLRVASHLQSYFDEGLDLVVSYPPPKADIPDPLGRRGAFDPRLGLVVPAPLPPVEALPILRSMI